MNRTILGTAMVAALLFGCNKQPEGANTTAASQDSTPIAPAAAQPNYDIPMTNLPALKLGAYNVQPMYEEDLGDGHFNIKIIGGEVAAVREWVGPEDASGVIVVKTEIENDYHHGHVEMPNPIPDDARLWIEIETPSGEKLKGSTPLKG